MLSASLLLFGLLIAGTLPATTVGQQPDFSVFCEPNGGTCERGPVCVSFFQYPGNGICPGSKPLCCYNHKPSEEITTEESLLPTTTVGQQPAPTFGGSTDLPDPCYVLGVGYQCERTHCNLQSYRVPGRCPRRMVCCAPDLPSEEITTEESMLPTTTVGAEFGAPNKIIGQSLICHGFGGSGLFGRFGLCLHICSPSLRIINPSNPSCPTDQMCCGSPFILKEAPESRNF